MLRSSLIALLVLAACAPPPSTEGNDSTPKQAAIFTSSETGMMMGDRPRAVTANFTAAPPAVWLAAKKVYADLEVPVTVESTASRQIGNSNFFRSRQFAGQAMTQFVDCGSGMTGPKAASYRIYMSLLTEVIPDGKGGTVARTTFVPMGQDLSGGSSDRIPCGTSGRLELLVLDKIKAALGPG
jgi:hypothetical protein